MDDSQNQPQSPPDLTQTTADVPEPESPRSESLTPLPGEGRWYVVHTYAGHENKVSAALGQRIESEGLKDRIFEVLVPTRNRFQVKEGKKETVKEKIFPGYLLVRMTLDDTTWITIRTTPGVTGFVGNAQKPTPIPDSDVVTILQFMETEAPQYIATFSLGEAIKITEGPFADFLGTVSELNEEKGKIKVLVSIFGRETPVELDFLQVAKL